ncbi:hypothetical protein [Nocardia sp. NPDC056564]|uniref:hypothetical protein n=1 Tax=Nocardia sp. NPDC056564 TaxID=3345865 RepID=UPI00367209F9
MENVRQVGRKTVRTYTTAEIASDLVTVGAGTPREYQGYRTRRVGSTSKGGQIVVAVNALKPA